MALATGKQNLFKEFNVFFSRNFHQNLNRIKKVYFITDHIS